MSIQKIANWLFISILCIFLAACGSSKPAKQGGTAGGQGQYRVVRGDTLTKIARQHGQSVNSLMRANNIKNPNHLKVGQILTVRGGSAIAAAPQVLPPPTASGKSIAAPRSIKLVWPAQGQNRRGTSATSSQGVYISGAAGSPIKAAAAGTVVYAGSGLRGYGNMIIVNHDANFLSVYAHNDKLLVTENTKVSQGQSIATMGSTDTNATQLYFELRYNGKAVDAMRYLP